MTATIFVSSVQRELAEERRAIGDFIQRDPLMRRFFSVVLFEDLPASDRRADDVYLTEVDHCAIVVSLLGTEYGSEDASGLSPTEREFDRATEQGKIRLVFVKGADDASRHQKMRALVKKVGSELIRRRFTTVAEVRDALYASLVDYLERNGAIQTVPLDARPCPGAGIGDLDAARLNGFLGMARNRRGFALGPGTPMRSALTHLDLLNDGQPTYAAVLLFARSPQRFLPTSEVKCAHFHGTRISKPIPSYQIYTGTVFELVDQAVGFVLSQITATVGTRSEGSTAPIQYELPREAVTEAIVNAVVHRDYASNASVQVMLFADRLEIWNPGELPMTLTLAALREPHPSVPRNPLLAGPMFLAGYIEKAGTGTLDMLALCLDAGLPAPEFRQETGLFKQIFGRKATPEVTDDEVHDEVHDEAHEPMIAIERTILMACAESPKSASDLLRALGYSTRAGNFRRAIVRLLESRSLELTIPDKPRSGRQQYRLTSVGKTRLDEHERLNQ